MSAQPWQSGDLVAGRYRLVERLGQGGMGAVWRAEDKTLACDVAVKVLSAALVDSEDGKKRFLLEAQAAAKLRSPHVVHVMDHGVDGTAPFIVMELLEGETLARRIAKLGRLTHAQTCRIVTQVARAMSKAHEAGIVHRDLKPENIFLVRNDDDEVAKVLDFGIAKGAADLASAPAVSTRSGALLGTPFYMSPEQVRGREVDWRTDLWALAVIAYECVVGRLPFASDTVGDLLFVICSEPPPVPSRIADVPAGFDAWFARGVCRDKVGRFQSARELASALARLDADAGDRASAETDSAGGDGTGATSTHRPAVDSGAVTVASDGSEEPSAIARSAPRSRGRGAPVDRGPSPAGAGVTGGALTRSSLEQAPPSRHRSVAIALAVGALMIAAFVVQRGAAPGPASDSAGSGVVPPARESTPRPPEPTVVPTPEPPAASASAAVAASTASAPVPERSAASRKPKASPGAASAARPSPTDKDDVLAF